MSSSLSSSFPQVSDGTDHAAPVPARAEAREDYGLSSNNNDAGTGTGGSGGGRHPHHGSSSSGARGSSSSAPLMNTNMDEEEESAFIESKIFNLRVLNGLSFALTAIVVVGVVLFGASEGGVFGDQFLWMKYQTLLTPADYVHQIWIPLFVLQGLFVYASTIHPTLRTSPLVGYDVAISRPRESVAVHYPAVCASTLMTIYSHDNGRPLLAFVSSVLCCAVIGNVLGIQNDVSDDIDDGIAGIDPSGPGGPRSRALRHASLRLPFEALGGYVLALVPLYFVTFLDGIDAVPMMVHLVAANVSMAGLTAAGFWALWMIPERKLYGVGASLVWYLLGVAVELHSPTQPIYNAFSDSAILATQVVAGVATTTLATVLGVRVTKTMIKGNLFTCGGRLSEGGKGVCGAADGSVGEDGACYVQA